MLFDCGGRLCWSRWPNECHAVLVVSTIKRRHRAAPLNQYEKTIVLSEDQANMQRPLCTVLLMICVSCSTARTTTPTNMSNTAEFEKLTDDLLYGTLALSPVAATQTGYHEHNGMPLDEALDDYSQMGIDQQRQFYEQMQYRVNHLNAASLDKEQQADLEIMKNQLNLQLLDLNTIQSFRHNPTIYVELAGNA